MFIIAALLIFSAIFCGGGWLWLAYIALRHRAALLEAQLIEIERQTFHIGLCFILAIGLLGLIWK